jgi:hypothetical protein
MGDQVARTVCDTNTGETRWAVIFDLTGHTTEVSVQAPAQTEVVRVVIAALAIGIVSAWHAIVATRFIAVAVDGVAELFESAVKR